MENSFKHGANFHDSHVYGKLHFLASMSLGARFFLDFVHIYARK
jgi:hypothetical protein